MAATATFKQIREGLVANLAPLGIQSTGYLLASPTPPTIEAFPSEVEYDAAFGRGMDVVTFTVRVTVSSTLDVPAQQLLDTYLAPSGVKALLETDRTLGGKVQTLMVTNATGHQIGDTKEGGVALSASWTVEIRT